MKKYQIIAVGDKIKSRLNGNWTITKVERGRYGLYIEGTGKRGITDCGFLPYELPPEVASNWYGWPRRGYIILNTGLRLGGLSFGDYSSSSLEECDKLWERTLALIDKERLESAEYFRTGCESQHS